MKLTTYLNVALSFNSAFPYDFMVWSLDRIASLFIYYYQYYELCSWPVPDTGIKIVPSVLMLNVPGIFCTFIYIY